MNTNEILILLLFLPPFIGAAISWLVDYFKSNTSKWIGILVISISAISATVAFVMINLGSWVPTSWKYTSVFVFSKPIQLSIAPDNLGIFMAMIASVLGLLIAIFSLDYMGGDNHLTRYWFYLQLFIGGIVLLVIAGDFVILYIGWEIVGLCSFGLISHWHNKPGEEGEKAGKAGIKAFVLTRIGDIGLLVAIVMIYQQTGSFEFTAVQNSSISVTSLHALSFLFLMAAFGKSGQIPFIPWLSSPESVDIDAMQGPTTVSALIHAATMVKAGVYLMSRVYLVFPFWQVTEFVWVFALVAGFTALIAALSAAVSFDLKRILAFSTVSQLSYMFLGIALAFILYQDHSHSADTAFLATQFHLISHAIFKSLLFLAAGYLIHEHGSRDIRKLRGSADYKKDGIAFAAFLSGGLALIGIPPLNGFFSKEALIGVAYEGIGFENNIFIWIYLLSVITTIITALYVTRMFYYIFTGSIDEEKLVSHSEHQGLGVMKPVLVILSLSTVLGGVFQLFLPSYFEPLLGESEFHNLFGEELIHVIILTTSLIFVIFLGWWILDNKPISDWITQLLPVRMIIIVAENGFYLENLWMGGWKVLKVFSYKFRRLHSGDLNDMMTVGLLTMLFVVFSVVGGI